jgi:hypothetical protein
MSTIYINLEPDVTENERRGERVENCRRQKSKVWSWFRKGKYNNILSTGMKFRNKKFQYGIPVYTGPFLVTSM